MQRRWMMRGVHRRAVASYWGRRGYLRRI